MKNELISWMRAVLEEVLWKFRIQSILKEATKPFHAGKQQSTDLCAGAVLMGNTNNS